MRRQELHPRTAVINKAQKHNSKKTRNEALLWLAASFPQVFDNTLRIRPLKTGIMEDILAYADQALAAGISKSKLREAVVLFTRRVDYLTCLKAREMRVDLQGNPVTVVTEEEAERAATKIKKRVEKSARNARKNLVSKMPNQQITRSTSQTSHSQNNSDFIPPYPERAPAYGVQNAATQTPRSAVIVKHKNARQFDPDAVARLREKLGISRKTEIESENID